MNSDQFVSSLVECVHEAAIQDVVSQLEAPSGKRPPAKTVALSQWYARLDEEDRRNLLSVVGQSVHAALFGALCVLDGARTLHGASTKHELQLLSVDNGASERINEPGSESLHDIYQGIVYSRVFE